jgi:hypothetical protein
MLRLAFVVVPRSGAAAPVGHGCWPTRHACPALISAPSAHSPPPMALKKSELYSSLWQSCDELRGGMDASPDKDYVLGIEANGQSSTSPPASHPGSSLGCQWSPRSGLLPFRWPRSILVRFRELWLPPTRFKMQ